MDCFKHGNLGADICRACQSDGTSNLRSDIREDIAIKIRHYEHVESFGGVRELCGANVDDPVLVFDVLIVCRDLIKHLVKQAVCELHDIVFSEARDLFSVVAACIFKGIANNLLRAGPRD